MNERFLDPQTNKKSMSFDQLKYMTFFFLLVPIINIIYRTDTSYFPKITYKRGKPAIKIVYVTCKEKKPFRYWEFNLPTEGLKCNKSNLKYDAKEAVPYLNWIIDNYDDPPADKIIFVHGHRKSWHYQSNIFRVVNHTIHQLAFAKNDYGGMYNLGWYNFAPWVTMPAYRQAFYEIFHNLSLMQFYNINSSSMPCCATFYVSSKNFKYRTKEEYKIIRDRIRFYSNKYSLDNPTMKLPILMEFIWHLLLGNTTHVDRKPIAFL